VRILSRSDKNNIDKFDSLRKKLREFIGSQVTIRTKSGDTLMGDLLEVEKSGLVELIQRDMVSPFLEDKLTFINLIDIESFSVFIPEEEEESSFE
jgi:hypothetical protein